MNFETEMDGALAVIGNRATSDITTTVNRPIKTLLKQTVSNLLNIFCSQDIMI